MSACFVDVDRETPMLRDPDMRDWGPEDDLVHFVIAIVCRPKAFRSTTVAQALGNSCHT